MNSHNPGSAEGMVTPSPSLDQAIENKTEGRPEANESSTNDGDDAGAVAKKDGDSSSSGSSDSTGGLKVLFLSSDTGGV